MNVKKENPKCSASDCFGCDDGKCVALEDNNFGTRKCPFYKTREQVIKEKADCELRLTNIRIGKEV